MPQPQGGDCRPFHFVPRTHITPIRCPHCDGDAHLMARRPLPRIAGGNELRTFACSVCGNNTEMIVES
jgi:hypothetical protein